MGYTNDTAITYPEITVGTDDIANMLEGHKTDAMADAISWFWEHFVSGKSLYQDIVEPLTGDFNRIKANGEAWNHTGRMLFGMGSNMELNARKLSAHWTGDAAQDFHVSVVGQWFPAMVAAEQVCKLIGKGFEAIAEASIRAARQIVTEIIPKIMKLIRRIARRVFEKVTPAGAVVGVIGMAWDFAKDGEFPGMAEVNQILELIAQVKALFNAIKAVVAVARQYVDTTTGIINLVKTLPKPGDKDVSIADGRQAVEDLKAQTEAAKQSYETYAGKPVTDKEGNLLDKDGNIVIDKDGNVVNPDGEVARKKSEHDKAVDKYDKELAEMERLRDKLYDKKKS